MITISNTSSTTPATSPAAAIHTPAKHAMITLVSQQQQQQQPQQSHLTTVKDLNEANVKGHLTAPGLGLKVKTTLQTAMQAITTNTSSVAGNPNSLLKQQLRAGLRIDFNDAAPTTNALPNVQSPANVHETHEACSALQSLATVAERQAQNHIQPPTANNLHHQFLLHMAANPMLKQTGEYFQQQQQQTRLLLREEENNIDLLMDQSDKSDPEMLTLADENAGLDYSASTENVQRSDKNENQESSNNNNTNVNQDNGTMKSEKSKNNTRSKNSAGKPIQRRRIRRKAQSTIDDQAEQLTEMSVRGLDLFRYASINEGVYQCTECAKENMQKTFKNKYSFQRHAFLYHEGKHRKVFPCPLCGKEFSRPDKMKNHMKMTHESFVSKEIQSFNPLNYLITAAASGEIQATFPQLPRPPPSQATSVANNITATSGQKQSSDNNGTQLNVLIGNNNDLKEGMTLTNMQDSKKVAKDVMMMAETDNFKFPTDIEIKNEIIISPSPSPPPTSLLPSVSMSLSSHSTLQQSTAVSFSFSDSLNLLKTASTAPSAQAAQMQNAQRLEEVK